MFENIIFTSPHYFYISIVCCIIMLVLFLKKSRKYNFLGLIEIQKAYKGNTILYHTFIFLILSVTLIFGVIFSGPTKVFTNETIKKNGIDIVIVFDVSFSMIAKDIPPSRIDIAKKVTNEFISQLQSDRLGVIVFAGKPFSSIPMTFDYDFIQKFFDDIKIDIINQERPQLAGTAIGDGLMLGSNMLLQDSEDREKVMILITDGEANRGIDPLVALSYVKEKNIKVYTIGVGKDEDTTIEIYNNLGFVQKIQVGPVDEKTLQKIARETGGKYYRADSEEAFKKVFLEIENLEKKEIETEVYFSYQGQYTLLLLLCILLQVGVGYFIFRKSIEI